MTWHRAPPVLETDPGTAGLSSADRGRGAALPFIMTAVSFVRLPYERSARPPTASRRRAQLLLALLPALVAVVAGGLACWRGGHARRHRDPGRRRHALGAGRGRAPSARSGRRRATTSPRRGGRRAAGSAGASVPTRRFTAPGRSLWLADSVVARFNDLSGGSEVAAMAEFAPGDHDGFHRSDEQQINGPSPLASTHVSCNEHGRHRWADARRQAAARQA